jgi:hypothetical protein
MLDFDWGFARCAGSIFKKGAMLAFDWGSPEDQNIPLVFKKECDSC